MVSDDKEQRPEPPARDDAEDERDRRTVNLFLVGFFIVVVGIGVWLANAMIDYRKLDDCMAQGRRNCAPIERPTR
jgi:hypothetical protein